jgi:hypothetical protein
VSAKGTRDVKKTSVRLVFAAAGLAASATLAQNTLNQAPAAARNEKAISHLPPPAKLHIKSLAVLSPACGKPVDFKLEVQNLSSGAFTGSTNINNRPGAVFTLTDTATNKVLMLPLGSIAGGGTLSVPVSAPTFVAACPGQACWEAALLVFEPDSTTPNLPEWDGVKGKVCLKQSCSFEITGPATR